MVIPTDKTVNTRGQTRSVGAQCALCLQWEIVNRMRKGRQETESDEVGDRSRVQRQDSVHNMRSEIWKKHSKTGWRWRSRAFCKQGDEAMSHDLLKPCGWGAVKTRGQWRVWEHEMEKTQHCKLWLSLQPGGFTRLRKVWLPSCCADWPLHSESVLHEETIRSSFDKRLVRREHTGCEAEFEVDQMFLKPYMRAVVEEVFRHFKM